MKKKILVLSGGVSKERLISIDTGNQVAKELKKNGYRVKISEPDYNLEKLFDDSLSENEKTQLGNLSILIDKDESWKYFSLAKRIQDKYAPKERKIGYLILIPTLRCNLSCSYCQVSRAPEKAKGYDWDEDTLSNQRNN